MYSQKSYEGVISQYKKKLEDAQELRKQLKATEEKNMMYVQQNLDLEEVSHVTLKENHVTVKSSVFEEGIIFHRN